MCACFTDGSHESAALIGVLIATLCIAAVTLTYDVVKTFGPRTKQAMENGIKLLMSKRKTESVKYEKM